MIYYLFIMGNYILATVLAYIWLYFILLIAMSTGLGSFLHWEDGKDGG